MLRIMLKLVNGKVTQLAVSECGNEEKETQI